MKLLNKYGYTKLELLVIVFLLGIVAFITIDKTSYAFSIDNTNTIKDVVKMIEIQAEDYAMDNLEIFNDTNTSFIIVNDLIEQHYLIGNSEGLLVNPVDNTKNFNDDKIELKYDKDKNVVEAKLLY